MVVSRRTFVGACALSALAMAGCVNTTDAKATKQKSFFCFDTACSIGGVMEDSTLREMVKRCQGFEQTLSRTIAESDIGRVNAAAGATTQVDPETADLVSLALDYCERSNGLFDITIGAVSELWDFHEGVVPSDEAIKEALGHVGWRGVHVEKDASTITLDDPHARIDLGGIAKGYVADVLLDELEAQGVTSAFVNLGGNVAVLGPKEDGTPWEVGVRDPLNESGEKSLASVRTEGGSVVTSGLYERQFEKDGRRYWHILDPRSGYPADSDIISASLYTQRSIDGDGLTKPLFMLGLDGALAFLEEQGVDGLLVAQDGSVHQSASSSFVLR